MGDFTYHYTASALGMGGVLKDDSGVTIVRSLASVALAPIGGQGLSEIPAYDSDGIAFLSASSHVTGYDSAYRTFTTSSDVTITNLNLFGRVKAASLQTSISSTREVLESDTPRTENHDKARFSMSSMIVGLTIDGVEVTPEIDLALCQCATYADVGKVYAKRRLAMPPANAQVIRASFVQNLQYTPTTTVGPCQGGFKIPVKNFGTIHLGELIVKPGSRTLNLLRIEFDSMLQIVPIQQVGKPVMAATSSALSDTGDATTTTPRSGSMTMLTLTGNGVPSWP
jgi:hypothetical protein